MQVDTCTLIEQKSKRNYGIDLLRLLAMFYVIILHVLGHGKILDGTDGVIHVVLRIIDVFAICAVDIYALISGYVGYTEEEKHFKCSRPLTIWAQVCFYSFCICLAVCIWKSSWDVKAIIRSFLPVSSNAYWYFSSYIPLVFLMPFINRFLRGLTKHQLTGFALSLFSIFSVFVTFASRIQEADPFELRGGTPSSGCSFCTS